MPWARSKSEIKIQQVFSMSETSKNVKKQPENYRLNSEAVETLAGADTEPIPRYSEEELKKYRSRGKLHIPGWMKAAFIKTWFAGAVCYFILWGLGLYIRGLDMLFVLAVGYGMVTDLLTNNVLRFLEATPGENNKWLLVTTRGTAGLFLNILLGMVTVAGVYFTYGIINQTASLIAGDPELVFLGVEPIVFGLFCMGVELLLLRIKALCASILSDARAAARRPRP